jgi:hypothetical protein
VYVDQDDKVNNFIGIIIKSFALDSQFEYNYPNYAGCSDAASGAPLCFRYGSILMKTIYPVR